jgi:pimeloyl-ACP methyl ester carboxylesterase
MFLLCRVTTADGLLLDGAFRSPPAPSARSDIGFLLIHGTGGNFYGSGILEHIARQAADDGFPVLRINTRGHDLAANIPGTKGSVRGGAAFEKIADAHLDVTAWIHFLVERGVRRVILVGHSLGGVKAFWSQAVSPHQAVSGIVGLSPPRFVHARFQADPRCDAFRRDFARAQQLVADGRGDELLTVSQPLPLIITAAGYLDKYGPSDPLDYVPILKNVGPPKLVLLGGETVRTNPAFAGLPEALASVADAALECEVLPDADINYRNDPAEPWRRIMHWQATQG